jgi:hypothetical protein
MALLRCLWCSLLTNTIADPTGNSFKTERVSGDNKEVSRWIDNYLGVGEWVMDQSVAIAGSSGFFERRR